MTDSHVLVSFLEIAVGVACLGVGALAWSHRTRPAGTPLVGVALAAAVWGFSAGAASLVVDPRLTRIAQAVTYAAGGVAALAWFFVAVEYTGREEWLRPGVGAVAAGLVLADVFSLATNPSHHLYVTEASRVTPAGLFDPTPGPLLWLHAVWKLGVVLLGAGLLVRRDGNREGIIGLQSAAVLVTGLLPPMAAIVELLDLVVIPGLDFGVVGVAAGSVFLLWALFYADFLDVVPIARETMLASMTDAVVAVDTSGRVVDVNERAKRLFAVGPETIGTRASEMLSGYPELLDDAGVRSETTEFATVVGGEIRHYEFESTPIYPRTDWAAPWVSSDGRPVGRLLVFGDVTVRKRHEQTVERKNARLEEFASVVSHDLRNPLNVAQGNVELAREVCGEGDEGDEYLSRATDALDRMERLIEEVLTLSRQGKAVEEKESVDVADLAERCWTGVPTEEANLVVGSERTILADRSRLQAVFENLFRNSVEHGSTSSRATPDEAVERDGPDVTVTVGDLDGASGFFVEDDGVGIPEEDRERVFESGHSTRSDGSGLGLAIVRVVAEAHGWTVTVTESEEGGARFEFTGVEFDAESRKTC